jgi:hypothetical protein
MKDDELWNRFRAAQLELSSLIKQVENDTTGKWFEPSNQACKKIKTKGVNSNADRKKKESH